MKTNEHTCILLIAVAALACAIFEPRLILLVLLIMIVCLVWFPDHED